jgi:hypothetical protein
MRLEHSATLTMSSRIKSQDTETSLTTLCDLTR